MTDHIRQAVAQSLPLSVEEVDYNDPMVVLAGSGWALSIACAWRLMRDERLATSWGEPGAAEVLAGLVGIDVADLGAIDRRDALVDMRVALADGAALEAFADTDFDPWVLRLDDETFVGVASSPEREFGTPSPPQRKYSDHRTRTVNDEMGEALAPMLPLRVEEVEYNDPIALLAGPCWSLSVACSWRLMRDDLLETSCSEADAAAVLGGLVGSEVVRLAPVDRSRPLGDIRMVLSDGAAFEVFVDVDLGAWVLRLRDHNFVGTASAA